MTDSAPTPVDKAPRERSPSFPFIPLETALNRLAEFESTFARQEPPADRAYLAWKMKGDTSQAQQTLGALRAFGLIEYKGSGTKRPVAISAEARNYLRAQQDSVKREALKRLALKPKWIAHFWDIWGADRVPDPIRLDNLVLESRFNEGTAPTFLRVYDATIAFAGLSNADRGDAAHKDEQEDVRQPAIKVGDFVQAEVNGVLAFPNPVRVRAVQHHEGRSWVYVEGSESGLPVDQVQVVQAVGGTPNFTPPPLPLPGRQALPPEEPAERAQKAGWKEERLLDDNGEETFLTYKGEPSVERYEFIRDYLEFRISRLKKS